MKKKIITILMALTLGLTACSGTGSPDAVAVVNGEEISRETFQEEYDLYRNMVYGQLSDEDMQQDGGNGKSVASNLASQVTDTLIMDKLIQDEFDSLGLEVSQEDKDEAMNNLIEQSGGEEAYNQQLEAMGITAEDMEGIVDKTLVQQAVMDNYIQENKKTDEEVQDYFDQNKENLISYDVAHILVESEEEANEIIAELEGGADFATLAEERSIDQGSAQNGGELGEITMQTNFVQPFLDAVKEMEEGEISDPVQSEYGYHIIKVNDIKDEVADFEEQIQNTLLDAEVNQYMQGLYEKAEIATYKPSMEEAETEESEASEESESEANEESETEADQSESEASEDTQSEEDTEEVTE